MTDKKNNTQEQQDACDALVRAYEAFLEAHDLTLDPTVSELDRFAYKINDDIHTIITRVVVRSVTG